ncbi:hypothetical protein [Endozoicomonas euniceicola]|uniref:SIR2-like domain-containing protein n=1 Tax=Endozoicomonas euniceicola TaxID=1234143 RepID=A0ABY6GQV3_9GAMM|nr:hypothetical protein [Endozoicomonas euniceicola]UYM14942.1 hypothetical protein NX720_18915 [Endozoicomonas euniceicola]
MANPDNNVLKHSNGIMPGLSFILQRKTSEIYNYEFLIQPDSLSLPFKKTPNGNKDTASKRAAPQQSKTSSAYTSGSGFHIPDRHGRKFSFSNEKEELANLLLEIDQILEEHYKFNFVIVITLNNIFPPELDSLVKRHPTTYQFPHHSLEGSNRPRQWVQAFVGIMMGYFSQQLSLNNQNAQFHDPEPYLNATVHKQNLLKKMVKHFHNYPNAFLVYNLTYPLQPEALNKINKGKEFTYSNHRTSIKLPVPDAVIANTGTQIIKHSALSSSRILNINRILKEWVKKDNDNPVKKIREWQSIRESSEKPFLVYDNIKTKQVSGVSLCTFDSFISRFNELLIFYFGMVPDRYYDGINEEIVNDRLQGKPEAEKLEPAPYAVEDLPHTILTPFEKEGVLKQVLFSNTRVNKGVALRTLINLMSIDGDLQGKPTFLIILGDSIVDLPMIRIDQKANALSQLTERQKTLAKNSITSLIDSSHEAHSQIIWLMSIAFNNLNLQSLTNPRVSEMLKHEKVKMVNGEPGLLTDMKAIVDQLKSTRFSMWDGLLPGH